MDKKFSSQLLSALEDYVGPDPSSIKRICNVILENLPDSGKSLFDAIEKENWENIAFFAHKIKSSYRMLNLTKEVQLLEQIEKECKINRDIDTINRLSVKIKNTHANVCEELARTNIG